MGIASGNDGDFFCPACEAFTQWGTSNCTGPDDTWVGHCYGPRGDGGCAGRFSWPRTEDGKHFRVNQNRNARYSKPAAAPAKAGGHDDLIPTFTPHTLRLVSEDMKRSGARAERQRIKKLIAPNLRALRVVERRLFSIKLAESYGEMKAALDGISAAMRATKGRP